MELIKTSDKEKALAKAYRDPIFALPQNQWDSVVCKGLIPRLLKMLSIDLEKNGEKVAMTELMIREEANRITPEQIEEAFVKYIKGQLPELEPRDNYLTPILFGKVIRAYKSQQPTEKPKNDFKPISEEQKELLVYSGVINAFDAYTQDKYVLPGYTWVFDHLQDKKIMSWPVEDKKKAMERAKRILEKKAKENPDKFKRQSLLNDLENKNAPAIINEAKRLLLGDYFEALIKDKMHIKEVL